jgi:hypothetical protein
VHKIVVLLFAIEIASFSVTMQEESTWSISACVGLRCRIVFKIARRPDLYTVIDLCANDEREIEATKPSC